MKSSLVEEKEITKIIQDVALALQEKGYDPINQIVGYLMSGDPGYISSYKGARQSITKYERTMVLTVLVKEFLK